MPCPGHAWPFSGVRMGVAGKRIGFLGFGKMARSIATGLQRSGTAAIVAYDTIPGSPVEGVRTCASAAELEEGSDILLLCVKPGDMAKAVSGLKGSIPCISIAAGLSLETLEGMFRAPPQLARSMPNIGATVGESTTAIYCPHSTLLEDAIAIFRSVGFAFAVSREDLMHAVTGLSGSGPAYVMLFLQALAEAGVREGLPFDDALRMSAHTASAGAALLLDQGGHPAEWIARVASPGGTTIEGLAALEEGAFKHAIYDAVHRATERSRELGRPRT